MMAAYLGHSCMVRILLNKGANASVANDDGFTALHFSVLRGHLAAAKLLVEAGADLESKISETGTTPLHIAAQEGHSELVRVLIEAGANPTAVLRTVRHRCIARYGQDADAVKELLRAKANPLLTCTSSQGNSFAPLDVAAQDGHVEAARELIQRRGIEGSGSATGGVGALQAAAENM